MIFPKATRFYFNITLNLTRNFQLYSPCKAANKSNNPLKWVISKTKPVESHENPFQQKKTRRKFLVFGTACFVCLGSVFCFSSIEFTPITKRRRLILRSFQPIQQFSEWRTNKTVEKRLRKFQHETLPDADPKVQRVVKIVDNVLQANSDIAQINNRRWIVHVVQSPKEQCFVAPNGHIFVHTGFLETFTCNDDQLAFALAHELSHVVLGHGRESLSRIPLLTFPVVLLVNIVHRSGLAAILLASIAFIAGVELIHRRKLELEADDVGLYLSTKACYDPRESYAMWTSLEFRDKWQSNNLLNEAAQLISVHPSHAIRAKRIEPIVSKALNFRSRCDCPPLTG